MWLAHGGSDGEEGQLLEPRPDSVSFELSERFAVPMPDDFALSGVAVSETGEVLAWTRGHAVLQVVDGEEATPIRLANLGAILAASLSDEHVEVLDPDRRVLKTLDRSSGSVEERNLHTPHEWTSAAKVGNAWIVGGHGSDGGFHVSKWEYGSQAVRFAVLPDGELVHHVSGSAKEVLLTRARDPFQVVRLHTDSVASSTPLASPMDVPEIAESVDDFWVSLPAVPLDEGYLQWLADTRSDRRILVIYSRDGQIQRNRDLELPIGFVASLPGRRMLFGARRIDGVEVVAYQWEWKASHLSPLDKEE